MFTLEVSFHPRKMNFTEELPGKPGEFLKEEGGGGRGQVGWCGVINNGPASIGKVEQYSQLSCQQNCSVKYGRLISNQKRVYGMYLSLAVYNFTPKRV